MRAVSCWSPWRTLTAKWLTSSIGACMVSAWLMQTSRLGGSIETQDMAVAVMPINWPSMQMVTTLTVAATRRIAWRNRSASGGSPGTAAADDPQSDAGE